MRPSSLKAEELRFIIKHKGFRVKVLAVQIGVDVRTLERRFIEQLRTTPKAWIMRERMGFAPRLLAEGLSNKQVAASLNYTCESNFCRDFKRHFGCTPQEFAHSYLGVTGWVAASGAQTAVNSENVMEDFDGALNLKHCLA